MGGRLWGDVWHKLATLTKITISDLKYVPSMSNWLALGAILATLVCVCVYVCLCVCLAQAQASSQLA